MLASKENTASLEELRALIEAGSVTPAVDRSYPLRDTAAAIREVMGGHVRGKIVVTI